MSDQIRLVEGYPPWAPAPDAEFVAEYHRYDIPLIGRIRQVGVDYLFFCLHGQLDAINLWAYATLTEKEVAALEQASGQEFAELAENFLLQDSVQIAMAHNWRLILLSAVARQDSLTDLTNAAAGALVEATNTLMGRLTESLQ